MQLFGMNTEKAPRVANPELVRIGSERVETLKNALAIAMAHDQPEPQTAPVQYSQEQQPITVDSNDQLVRARAATQQAYGNEGNHELAA